MSEGDRRFYFPVSANVPDWLASLGRPAAQYRTPAYGIISTIWSGIPLNERHT